MQDRENVNISKEYVVALPGSTIKYLTALAIVDGTSIGDQIRSGIDDFVGDEEVAVAELIVGSLVDTIHTVASRRPSRLLLSADVLNSIEHISEESSVLQSDLIDVALHRYIGRRLADPSLQQKIIHRSRND